MKRHAIAIAAALPLLGQQGAAVAQPDPVSANSVMIGCRELTKSQKEPLRQGTCFGIVRAMFFYGKSHFGICAPDKANVGQAIRVVIAYIDQRPSRMNERFEDLALEALQQAWPCRR